MSRRIKIMVAVLMLLSLSGVTGFSQAQEPDPILLDEIVVTGTKSEKKVLESPVSVSIISEKEIEQSPVMTVDEAVQYMPGSFHWKRTGFTEPHPFVLMRGFQSSSRNLALIDGMTLNYPPYQSINWMSVPLITVARIEQVRGPFSSLYGGSAMGGVINIISKTPEQREINLKASYGSNETMIGQFSYGDRFADKFSLLLAYEGRKTDGYPSRFITRNSTTGSGTTAVSGWEHTRDVTDSSDLYILGDRGDENNEECILYGKLSLDITPYSRLSFSVNHYDKEFERDDYNSWLRDENGNLVDSGSVAFLDQRIDVNPGTFLMGTGNSSRKQTRYIASYRNSVSDAFSLEITAGLNDTPESISNTPNSNIDDPQGEGLVSDTNSEAYIGEIKTNLKIGQRQLVTAGVSYERNSSEDTYSSLSNWTDPDSKVAFQQSSKGKTENYGVYLQDEIKLHDTFTVYLGGRYDYYKVSDGEVTLTDPEYSVTTYESNSEAQLSPKLSLHYRFFENTIVRGSVGKSFRGPLISELYKKAYHNPNIWMYGNPELKPETATSWELGIVQSFRNKKSHIAATYFESYVDDMINSIPLSYDPETGTATETKSENIGKAEIKGVEAELRHQFNHYLTAIANFTWLDAITKEHPTNKEYEGKQLTLIPEYMANIGLNLSMYGLEAGAMAKYRSKIYGRSDNLDEAEGVPQAYDEIFLVDLKIGYNINNHIKASLSVNDVFDEEPFYNYLMPGRTFLGTVAFIF
jgi:iron complex outermembrane receptor protein